ncbi:MAG: hypothetical protein J0H15_01335 [Xanthomonadales bacterium]|nr:hypothetical protein [Xanthomonadales bacterium]
MIAVEASAPGKLVLLGDYAVLEGAPALGVAIDRRARARVVATDDGVVGIDASDLGVLAATARLGTSGLEWSCEADVSSRLSLVESLCNGLAERGLLAAGQGFHIELDTSGFFTKVEGARHKLGLGSSAALTVALASALACAGGHDERVADQKRWLGGLLELHRAWQGGQGSGVDIAASLAGRFIRFEPGTGQHGSRERDVASHPSMDARFRGHDVGGVDPGVAMRAMPNIERLAWPPAGASCLFLWSGQSVSTAGQLDRLAAWRDGDPAGYDRHMGALCRLAEQADQVLQQDAATFVELVDAYSRALEDFATASGIVIFTARQLRAARLAREHGAAYKPCGAGGDFGVLVADTPRRLDSARRAIIADCPVPALSIDATGLVLDPPFIPTGPVLREARAADPHRA